MQAAFKLLEDQGFAAEHKLLVQLFGCFEIYWNTPGVGSPFAPKDNSRRSLIEEGESLEEELLKEVKLFEDVSTKKKGKVKQVEKETIFHSGESFNGGEFEDPSIEDLFSHEQELTKKR